LSHPSHKNQINNLKRIEGQLRGVQRMIEEGDYCIDILTQIKAIKNSIVSVEGKILKSHLRQCVRDSLNGDDTFDDKVDEIVRVLKV
jgi:DNA-binding FrmR family transcriptional regulator